MMVTLPEYELNKDNREIQRNEKSNLTGKKLTEKLRIIVRIVDHLENSTLNEGRDI